jgi:hypothetical protein
MSTGVEAVLREACRRSGLDGSRAELIRVGENSLYRLPGAVVARVTRRGQIAVAGKELRVSRWLREHGVPVVEASTEVTQPVDVDGYAVTFWRELPPHRRGTTLELAELLKQLHALPPPDFELPPLAPFVRLAQRLAEAPRLPEDDRTWLLGRLVELERQYSEPPGGLPWCAIHGDAWGGNVAVTQQGRGACGPRPWGWSGVP